GKTKTPGPEAFPDVAGPRPGVHAALVVAAEPAGRLAAPAHLLAAGGERDGAGLLLLRQGAGAVGAEPRARGGAARADRAGRRRRGVCGDADVPAQDAQGALPLPVLADRGVAGCAAGVVDQADVVGVRRDGESSPHEYLLHHRSPDV